MRSCRKPLTHAQSTAYTGWVPRGQHEFSLMCGLAGGFAALQPLELSLGCRQWPCVRVKSTCNCCDRLLTKYNASSRGSCSCCHIFAHPYHQRCGCVVVQVTASQLSLLEATMAKMERVAVWSLMSGGGSGQDVFTVSACIVGAGSAIQPLPASQEGCACHRANQALPAVSAERHKGNGR